MSFSLNPFMSQIRLQYFFFFSLSFLSFFYIFVFIIIIIIIIIIIVHVYVFSTCTNLVEKRIRFPQGLSLVLYLYFRIFHFCIAELWILVKYTETKNKKKKRILKAHYWWSVQLQTTQFLVLQRDCKNQVIEKIGTSRGPRALL